MYSLSQCSTRDFQDKTTLCKHLRDRHKGETLDPDTRSRLRIVSCPQCNQIFSSLKKHAPGKSNSCISSGNYQQPSTLASLDPTNFFPLIESSLDGKTSSIMTIPISQSSDTTIPYYDT